MAEYIPEHLRNLPPAVREQVVKAVEEARRLNPMPPMPPEIEARFKARLRPVIEAMNETRGAA